MKLVLKVVFMISEMLLHFAVNFFGRLLPVIAFFWVGFWGGVLAQRMDYSDNLSNQLMAIFGAILIVSFTGWAIIASILGKPRNHADTIAKTRAMLGFSPRRDDASEANS